MSEETLNKEVKECKCCECMKKFAVITSSVFVGTTLVILVSASLLKPAPMPAPAPGMMPPPPTMMSHGNEKFPPANFGDFKNKPDFKQHDGMKKPNKGDKPEF